MPITQAPATGVYAALGMSASGTLTEGYEFQSETIAKKGNIIQPGGIRGTRSRNVQRLRSGTYVVNGNIVLEPGPTDLDNLFPRIMGSNKSGNTISLTEALPYFACGVLRGASNGVAANGTFFSYPQNKIDVATFRCGVGGPLELTLAVEGLSEATSAGSGFPSLTIPTLPPYILPDSAVTLNGSTYQVHEVEIVFNNHLKKDRFVNSITRTDLPEMDREVFFNVTVPATSDTIPNLYDQGVGGIPGSITFTNGTYVLTFTFGSLVAPTESPTVPSRDEEVFPLRFMALRSGGTLEVSVSNKSS